MLDAFIIEQIRRREERESNRAQHENRLQLPVPFSYDEPGAAERRRPTEEPADAPSDSGRGVVIVDFRVR